MIDREHSKFNEFNQKWQKITNEMSEELDAAEEEEKRKNEFYGQLDGKFCEITKEYAKKFKQLQNEYAFLYYRK